MTYDYKCDECENVWESNLPMSLRDQPLGQPCPICMLFGSVRRLIAKPSMTSDTVDPIRRAGSGWNDVLQRVKKASGRKNKIRVL